MILYFKKKKAKVAPLGIRFFVLKSIEYDEKSLIPKKFSGGHMYLLRYTQEDALEIWGFGWGKNSQNNDFLEIFFA